MLIRLWKWIKWVKNVTTKSILIVVGLAASEFLDIL